MDMTSFISMKWTGENSVTVEVKEAPAPGMPWTIQKSLSNSKQMEASQEADLKLFYDASDYLTTFICTLFLKDIRFTYFKEYEFLLSLF